MIALIGVLLFYLAAPAWSQEAGKLSGRVLNSGGTGLANTTIIITSTTGESRRVMTGTDGSFTLTLPPGSYDIEIETAGMQRRRGERVTISPTAPSTIDITLEGAADAPAGSPQSGSVEIQATASTLQTESAEVSRSYGTRTVRSLPLLDRQHQELTGLMPGVSPPTVSDDQVLDPQRTRYFSVNGQPSFANVHHQDGALHTEAVTQQVLRIPSNEAVQHYNIRTSNYNAEYGFAGGSWTNSVMRPGTNQFHGSAFAFNTNNFFTTRNPLLVADVPAPRFTTNQFGLTAGGPIIPSRMFIFGSYEGTLRRGNDLRLGTVPTAEFRAGNFTTPGAPSSNVIFDPTTGNPNTGAGRVPFPSNQIPASQTNPLSRALLGFLPAANQPGTVNNLVGITPLVNDQHRFDGKLDHRFTDNVTGFLHYGFTHGDLERGALLGPLGDGASSQLRNHTAIASVSANWSNTFLSEFRFGFGRYRNLLLPFGDTSQLSSSLSNFGFGNGIPNITIAGFSPFGLAGNYPSRPINNTFNPATNWIAHTGRHRLKFGGEVRHIQASGFDAGFFSPRGSIAFGTGATASPGSSISPAASQANAFAAFLLGAPSQAGVSSFAQTPTYRQTQTAVYATDTINLWSRLYLELGVRYDVYSPLRTRNDGGSFLFDPTSNSVTGGVAGANDIDNYDWNNIAPRIGLAFQPISRMVVRGGYGIHYFPTPFQFAGLNQAASAAQAGVVGGFGTVPFQVPTASSPGTGSSFQAGNQPFFLSESGSRRTPYVQTYSMMIQTDLSKGFLFDIGYVGTLGRQLPFTQQIGAAAPGTGLAGLPFAQFNRTAATTLQGLGLNNNYNSLQVNLTKRFSSGLAFTGAYTYSKTLDSGFELLNPFERSANYGPADTDRTHVLAVSHVWMLPFGAGSYYFKDGVAAQILGNWELNGILSWATGTPYTVTADPLLCNCPGISGVTANVTGPVSFNGSSSFDPSQFSVAQTGGFGNLGRNALRGPDLFNYNLSLFRNFPIRDSIKLELRGEAYNLTNSTNFANPIASMNAAGFGRSLRTFNGIGGRQFQIGGRLLF